MRRRARRTPRELLTRILVVTEGERTEPQYVERLSAFLRSGGSTTHVRPVGVGKDPLTVVKKCMQLRDAAAADDRDYQVCVCLVDVDRHASLDRACALARAESIVLLVSNLKFEVWLRWHVERSRSALTSSQLDELMSRMGLLKGKVLPAGFPIERVDAACAVARQADPCLSDCRCGPDPSTAMPILVDLIRGGDGRAREP